MRKWVQTLVPSFITGLTKCALWREVLIHHSQYMVMVIDCIDYFIHSTNMWTILICDDPYLILVLQLLRWWWLSNFVSVWNKYGHDFSSIKTHAVLLNLIEFKNITNFLIKVVIYILPWWPCELRVVIVGVGIKFVVQLRGWLN